MNGKKYDNKNVDFGPLWIRYSMKYIKSKLHSFH